LDVRRLDFSFDELAVAVDFGDAFPEDGFVFELRELVEAGFRNTFNVWRKLLVSEFLVVLDAVVKVLIVKGFSEHHDSALE
jgi:hypothetical protein